jgi:microcystin degradation protein MlrC
VVTLDLYGNITEKMAANANALIAVRTCPHVDYYERA